MEQNKIFFKGIQVHCEAKRLLVILLLGLFLISLVSAETWDDSVDYNTKDREYTITNAFGLGDEIAKIKLKTPHNNIVGAGYQKVAEIKIKNGEGDWEDIIGGIELFYINEDGSYTEFERQIDIKIRVSKEVDNTYFSCTEGYSENGTFMQECKKIINGTKDIQVWEDFNNSLIKNKRVVIGLFTNVEVDDYVEWIPTLYGHQLTEWASWTSNFDVGLVSYYKLDETSGVVLDSHNGLNDGTNNGSTAGVAGKLNTAYEFNGINSSINISDDQTINFSKFNFTISFWVKPKSFVLNSGLFSKGTGTKDILEITTDTDGSIKYHLTTNTGGYNVVDSNYNLTEDEWNYVVITWNGSAQNIYINGTLDNLEFVSEGKYNGSTTDFWMGKDIGANNFNGTIDEFGIWNRTLNSTEILGLYNNSYGLTYPRFLLDVNLMSPEDDFSTSNKNINFTCFVESSLNLTNVSFMLNGVINETNSSGFNNTNYTFEKTLEYGNYNWSCKATNNESNIEYPTNRTLKVFPFTVNSETYNTTTFETQSETFTANITTLSTVQSVGAFLYYNGTTYAGISNCVGTTCILTKIIDIPLITGAGDNENKSFFWQVTVFDGQSLTTINTNTTTHQQNVSKIEFGKCGAGEKVMNISIFKESDQTSLTADFKGTFTYYFGSGTVTKTNVTTNSSTSVVEFCVDENEDYTVTSQIELSATGYETRLFDFVKETYNNVSVTQKSLYLLNSSASSNIIIEVKDQGLTALVGILVKISKFLPETGEYIVVESQLTDDFGQFVAKLIENNAKYKFEFYDSDGTLLKTSPDVTIACKSTYCIIPFIVEISFDDFEEFKEISLYTYELSFNNATNTFIFSWDDRTGDSTTTRLEVTRYLLNGSSIVCNTTSTSTLDVLNCAVGDQEANYKAQAFRKVGTNERRIAILTIEVGSPVSTYGVEGLLWVFILLFTLIAVGAFNPTAGAALYGIGFVMFGILGLISMPIAVFFANTLLVVIFIWAVNKK